MNKHAAVLAYRDSQYEAAAYDQDRRIDSRMKPIVGGMWDSLKLAGNSMWRPVKVGKALFSGYEGDENRPFPKMPEVPTPLQGSSLGKAFAESWKLKQEATEARLKSFSKLLDADLSGWHQNASIASFAEARDKRVVFPEEGVAHDSQPYGGNGSLPMAASKTALSRLKYI